MKNWILKNFFQKDLEEIKRQGSMDAFTKAHADIMETMRDDLDKKAEELAKKKLNDLLSAVDLLSIVTLNKPQGLVYIGGEKADEGQLLNLKAEAEYIAESNLWKLLQETPKELAQKAMFVAGESLDDMKKGRSILYTLATQKNIVEVFKNFIPKK